MIDHSLNDSNATPDFVLSQSNLTDKELTALSTVLAAAINTHPQLPLSSRTPRSRPGSRRWGRAARQQVKFTRTSPGVDGAYRWGRNSRPLSG